MIHRRLRLRLAALLLSILALALPASGQASKPASADKAKPIMADFIGLCVHTVQFKPALYQPVAKHVRDYHPIEWDFGDDTGAKTEFPFAKNRVDWGTMYGQWNKAGFQINASLMFDNLKPGKWKDMGPDAEAYGKAFAGYFGPSHQNRVAAVEIGNEPGKYSDAEYRKVFEHMARGVRAGDPKMTILTCNALPTKSGDYHKSLDTVKGLDSLYDVINVHTYAQAEPWPTWRRSYPEDPKIPYLKDVRSVIDWRNQHAAGKGVWITEFGWDATTKKPKPTGDFAKWVTSTETEQALYTVRSYMIFSSLDVGRAYLYWFNDTDEPQLHGSSGLTRNYKPKPAYWAVAHLLSTLGEYRFEKAIKEDHDGVYLYAFRHGSDPKKSIRVAWLASGSGKEAEHTIDLGPGKVVKAERSPLKEGKPEEVMWEQSGKTGAKVKLTEAPAYFLIEEK